MDGFTTDGDRITGIRGRASGGGVRSPNPPRSWSAQMAGIHGSPASSERPNTRPSHRSPAGTSRTGAACPIEESGFTSGATRPSSPFPPTTRCSACSWGGRSIAWRRCGRTSTVTSWPPSTRFRTCRRAYAPDGERNASRAPRTCRTSSASRTARDGRSSAMPDATRIPILALGMCDALRDVELLVEALDEGLSGRRALADALRDYERRRNEASAADYRENLHMARFLPVPEETYRLRAALRADPAGNQPVLPGPPGMIPREAFFNPENLQRLLERRPSSPERCAARSRRTNAALARVALCVPARCSCCSPASREPGSTHRHRPDGPRDRRVGGCAAGRDSRQ